MEIKKQHNRGLMKGAMIGTVLIAVGLILQLCFGAVRWELIEWPVNIVILAAFIVSLTIMHFFRGNVHLFAWLSGYQSAISAMIFSIGVTIALGVIEQKPSGSDRGIMHHLLSAWPFVMLYAWLTTSLGMTILKVGTRRWTWRTGAFMLNHVGLFVVLTTATLGSADIERLTITVGNQSLGYGPQDIAYDETSTRHRSVELDFAVELNDFEITYHSPDSIHDEPVPESYTSHVRIYNKSREKTEIWGDTVIKVNKPVNVRGWNIYQYGYGGYIDGHTVGYSRLMLVRDPWLPWVYAGIFMLLAGAVTLFFTSKADCRKK